jgi:ATP-dependent DNA helicase RecQ
VKRQILDLLSHSPLTPAETADQIKAEKEDIGQVIRYLLDEGELKMQDGMLHISK